MKKLFALLLVAQVGLGFGQDAVDSAKEVADQASSVSEKLQDSEYVDIAPRVGFKINIGTVATLGESAIGEAGFVLSPTILATMNFNKSTFSDLMSIFCVEEYSPVSRLIASRIFLFPSLFIL